MDMVIKNGTIVTASSIYQADVEISEGKIKTIGIELPVEGKKVVDAAGMYLLPGAIDLHTHMSSAFGGAVSSDDEITGSIAAACGGVTTMFDFATQAHGGTLTDAIVDKIATYQDKACIDYALHCIVTDLLEDDKVLDEFPKVAQDGVNSFKCYLTYKKEGLMLDNEQLAKIMKRAKEVGGVTTIHAEHSEMMDELIVELQKEGNTTPWHHYLSRPEKVAAKSGIEAIEIAKRLHAPLYIVHMDNKECLETAAEAKRKGYPIFVETCPQYLEFNNEIYKTEEGIKFVCSPPIKGEESRVALWNGIKNGDVDTIATDHCPFTLEEKNRGKDDFTQIPNGCGGIENRFPYMLSEAQKGKLSFSKVVELCCERPAKLFGCGNKGSVEVGKDADIVIYNPSKEVIAERATTHTACDHSIWDGYKYIGYPIQTYLRGKLIFDNGNYVGNIGDGRYLKREVIELKDSYVD